MKGLEANLCIHGGDMLAYLYDEMPSADRDTFELHLADCGTCIDDFAELSQSRYPVYEWKQVDFDPLLTPRIAIDYEQAASTSWFDKFRAAFAVNLGYAFGGVAAMLLIGVAAGLFILSGRGEEIADNVEPSPSPTRVIANTESPEAPNQSQAALKPEPKNAAKPKVESASTRPEPRPVRAKATTRTPKRNEKVPVYSTADDDEDDSLRLADIFAELDTSE